MKRSTQKLVLQLTFIGLCLVSNAIAEESRILMDAYVNDQPVKLMFDTGAEGPVLFKEKVARLKLAIKEPTGDVVTKPGEVKLRLTEKCKFRLMEGGAQSAMQFAVIDLPSSIKADFDGVMGWGGIKHMMVEMDPSSRSVKIRDTIHFKKSEWKCLDIRKDLNILVIKASNEDDAKDCLSIDTGSPFGLTVSKELWQQLAGDPADSKTTLLARYTPGVGLVVDKEKWIREINFGALTFCEIPIKMGLEANQALIDAGIDGIIGIWSLSCHSWIVDGSAGKIYFKKNNLTRIPEIYDYNRLGAVFVPKDIQTGNALIAHVVKGGPAYTAGIRDGDELLRIGQLDTTKWRTDPDAKPGQYWEMPAGTVMDLELMRDGKKMEITVTLEEIFR